MDSCDLNDANRHKRTIIKLLSISGTLLVMIGVFYTINAFSNSESTPTPDSGSNSSGEHQVIDRTQWGSRSPLSFEIMAAPIPMIIIKHTAGGQCFSFENCAGKVQTIQHHCIFSGLSDISYNFLIGGDGNIYVGRDWEMQPEQRQNTIDIAFIGNYDFDTPSVTMIEAAQLLIQNGVDKNKLTQDYILVAHNQTQVTVSPGSYLFKEIVNWPHYDPRILYKDLTT